jgi:hypothetical protein
MLLNSYKKLGNYIPHTLKFGFRYKRDFRDKRDFKDMIFRQMKKCH